MRQTTTSKSKVHKKPVSKKAVTNSKKSKSSPKKASKSEKVIDGGMPTFAPVNPSERLSPRDQQSPVHDHERVH